MMKSNVLVLAVLALFLLTACNQIVQQPTGPGTYAPIAQAPVQPAPTVVTPPPAPAGMKFASFNIQVLGLTKEQDLTVNQYLPGILQQYDFISIQELREGTGHTADWLVGKLPGYVYTTSPRLGNSTSKEQYLLVYKSDIIVSNPIVYPDPHGVFDRPPWAVQVTARGKSFILIALHDSPTDAERQIRDMQWAIPWFQAQYNMTDFIFAGDLNSDCTYYNENLYYLKNYNWLIDNSQDTTIHTSTICTYDRIITDMSNVTNAGVDHFDSRLGLTEDQALHISDHYPVYATVG